MVLVSEGLKLNRNLQRLVLDGNNIQQGGSRALYKAVSAREADGLAQPGAFSVSDLDCNVIMSTGRGFDRNQPSGQYSLDMEIAVDRECFVELIRLVMLGAGVFLPYPEPRIDEGLNGEFKKYQIEIPEEGTEEGEWEIPDVGIVEFR